MRRIVSVVLLAAFLAGCHARFSEQEASFIGINKMSHDALFVVNGDEGRGQVVPANRSVPFDTEVPIPYNRVGSTSPTSVVDKHTPVDLTVRDLVANVLYGPARCTAGGKVVTSIVFEASFVSCYAATPVEIAAAQEFAEAAKKQK